MKLEEIHINDDNDRQKVIEYLKDIKFDLENYKVENFELNFKGLALIDEKGRKIIAYNNSLVNNVEMIYKELEMTEEEVVYEIKDGLWEDYLMVAEDVKETVLIQKPNEGEIQFFRYKKDNNENINEIHQSPIFKENKLYDIHDYLLEQVREMDNRRRGRKS